ncbi:hypothetical protein BD410DRAFT_882098 [Rickenella mellea]|uniref:Fungal pheromone STE3G-protein-coupled receptor n=1 Tax=Rickenella mellea TaxID=50990 RepID=A0A4Y7QG05_9AGAM|nr:hypothetical protein BD410DRAFT_882098 [Rickenella mellea]
MTVNTSNVQMAKHLTELLVALQIFGGQIALPLFVGTLLVSGRLRAVAHPVLINFCITWILYSIVYCLTVYGGLRHESGGGKSLCMIQGILVHGAVPMYNLFCSGYVRRLTTISDSRTAASFTSLAFHVWHGLQRTKLKWTIKHPNVTLIMMLWLPYIFFLVFAIFSAVVTMEQSELPRSDFSYFCTLHPGGLLKIVPAFAAVAALISIVLEVHIFTKLFRLREIWSRNRLEDPPALSMVVRIGVFSIFTVVGLAVSVVSAVRAYPGPFPDVVQTILPLVVFLVFGTRKDVFLSWSCCGRTQSHPDSKEYIRMNSLGSPL